MTRKLWTRWWIPALMGQAIMSAGWGCTSDGNLGQIGDQDSGLPGVQPGQCGQGIDRNGNGLIDEGCICIPGETEACFTGPVTARNMGQCQDGTIACSGTGEFGTWGGQCVGAVLPAEEQCNGLDDDCDGAIDEGCGCDTEGVTRECGASGLAAPCRAGTQTCEGGVWSACVGAVAPQAEQCGNGIDDNCDGKVDELCDCVPSPEACDDGIDNDCDGVVDEGACLPRPQPEGGVAEGGEVDAGQAEGGEPDSGTPACTGAGDWTVQVPAQLYSGDVNSSPGGMVRAVRAIKNGHGVLVAGHVLGAKADISGVLAESTPMDMAGGVVPQNLFVLGLDEAGTARLGYAPVLSAYPPPNPFNARPGVFVQGFAPDGNGGFWAVGAFTGIMETAPGKQYTTPVPVSQGQVERDAFLIHGDGEGNLVDSRVFGRDGQVDAFGQIATQGGDLLVTCPTADYFPIDGVPVLAPSASSITFLTMSPGGGSYAPTRIDYVDPEAGSHIMAAMAASGGSQRRLGIGGVGPVDFAGKVEGQADKGLTAIITPETTGLSVDAYLGIDGYYTYATSLKMNAGDDMVVSGGLRGSVSFGGEPLSTGGFSADDGFGVFIASLRADGSHRWSRVVVASPVDPFHSVTGYTAIGDDGRVYFAGQFGNQTGSTVDFGDGPVTVPAEALLLAVYDADGALLWSKVEDESGDKAGKVLTVNDVADDGCGGFYVIGDYWMGTWARGMFVRHIAAP